MFSVKFKCVERAGDSKLSVQIVVTIDVVVVVVVAGLIGVVKLIVILVVVVIIIIICIIIINAVKNPYIVTNPKYSCLHLVAYTTNFVPMMNLIIVQSSSLSP